MKNSKSLEIVGSNKLSDSWLVPRFADYSFIQIPGTIRSLLLQESSSTSIPSEAFPNQAPPYSQVVVLLLDGFGWNLFEKLSPHSKFLQKFLNGGVASAITSQFPSTTAVHMTSYHFNRPLRDHGISEWFYFEPKVDAVIAPLLFSQGSSQERGDLKTLGIKPENIFPWETAYYQFKKDGIESHVFQNALYAHSDFSRLALSGASVHPFTTLKDLNIQAKKILESSAKAPRYVTIYVDEIDSLSHRLGPDSPELIRTVLDFLNNLDEMLESYTLKEPTLLVVTADHGQTTVDPRSTIYLDERVPELIPYLDPRTRHSNFVAPTGGPRDLFLHLVPGSSDEVKTLLKERLGSTVSIYSKQDLTTKGVFGPDMSNALDQRIGDLILLPTNSSQTIWWWNQGRSPMKFLGHHGGMTRDEILSTFLTANLT